MIRIRTIFRRRRALETAAVVAFLVFAAWFAGNLTPSRAHPTAVYGSGSDGSFMTYRARVQSVDGSMVKATLLDGPDSGTLVTADALVVSPYTTLHKGSVVVVSQGVGAGEYGVIDSYRLPFLIAVAAVFVLAVVLVGRRRGATSLIGLGVSIIIIAGFVIPQISKGTDALAVCALASFAIAFSSIVIAHGACKRTFIAVGCVVVLLALVVGGDALAVGGLHLTGVQDETTYYLAVGLPHIKLTEVIVGGLIIASLGALDDIVTSQVAAIDELKKANPALGVGELYRRSLSVGREHIASLVNTLALLYAGASLPTLITIVGNNVDPLLVLNSEDVVTAIIQALLPGIALVVAVPFSSIVAALVLNRIHSPRPRPAPLVKTSQS